MISLKNINIKYDDFSLKNLSINVEKGEYYVILGESGAGKSIILEMLVGLISPDSGKIFFNNEDITKLSIQKREIGIVFQDYAIFPHLSVYENIAYPIKRKFSKKEIKLKVEEIAEKTEILHLLKRKPNTLSGGELQRIAIARTLILNPKVLLLDEPLMALDAKLRENLRDLLRKLNKQGLTIIHVTHDYEEALSLASKIAVIHKGELIQEDIPTEIFQNPKSEFVARFTGIRNFFKAKYISIKKVVIKDDIVIRVNPNEEMYEGYILIPSESITISNEKQRTSSTNNFKGTIKSIFASRTGKEVIVDIGVLISIFVTSESVARLGLMEEKEIWISFKVNSVKFINKL